MSKSVEERIVEMRFDNQQFEKGVQTTMGTLDRLKQSLKLDGATKGLEDVDKAAKEISLSGLSSAVETVKTRFSALEVVAITALANITNSVVNTGKRLVESLSVDQISAGWEKFANKTTSVGTLISQGYGLDAVNEQLERLNWFTDETSYNFTDMVANISKFTASGKGLEESVTAMEGIANWAALSGQNAGTASRAMYQLAQAMSAGYMRLEDYKSIQNASMDTEEFRQKCLDAAVALGTLKENADGTYESLVNNTGSFTLSQFTGHLTEDAWMTSDVMMKVFNDYSAAVDQIYEYAEEKGITASQAIEELGDSVDEFGLKAFRAAQEARTWSDVVDSVKDAVSTGWMNTFEIIFGNYEEAKELWTDLANAMYDVFAAGAEDRNAMLEEWKELGGRTAIVEAFWTAWENVGEILGTVKEAFREVFPSMTAKRLYSLTTGLKEFASRLKLSDKDSKNLKNTFKGLFAVLDIVKQGIGAVVKAIAPMTKGFGGLGSGILSLTGRFGEWLVSIDQAIKKNDAFNKAVEKVYGVVIPILRSAKEHIHGAVTAMKEFAQTHFRVPDTSEFMSFSDKLKARIEPFKKIGEVAKAVMSKLVEVFKATAPVLSRLGGVVVDTLGKVCDGIVKAIHGEGFDSLIDLLNGGMMVGIGSGIMKFIKNLTGMADDTVGGFKGIVKGIKGVLNGTKETLADFQASLKSETLMKIAEAIAILAGSLLVLSLIDSGKLGGALASISILFGELAASMALFDKTLGAGQNLKKTGTVMIEMSAAILILASALKKIAGIDSDKLAGALIGVTALIGEMVAASLALSKWGGKAKTSAVGMILFAEAINVLAKGVGKLAEIDTDKLTRGLVGAGVLMGELAAFMAAAKFGNFKVSQGLAIIELSAALLILEKSVSGFGSMDIDEIKQGLIGVGGILAEVAAFSVITGKAKHILSSATALTVIGAAMLVFGKAIKDIGSLSIESIGKGLLGIGGALASVAVAVNFMPKNMVAIGLGLVEVAAALKIIGGVIKDAGGMKWEEIGKGMVVLGGSMTILAAALNAMKGTLGAASAMLVMAAALAVFTPILKSLGSMKLEEIGKALLTLAGTFTVLGVAGAVLGPMVPAILGLSAALTLLGVAVAACGVGLLAFSAGLASLAVSGVAGVTALVAVLEILIVGILGVIADSATAIAGAVKAVVLAIVDVIVECAPAIAEGALTLIEEVLKSLAAHGPNIVTYFMGFLIGIINALASRLPELIKAAVNLIGAFFQGVVDALKGIDTTALLEGIAGIGLLSAIMLALSAVVGLIPGAMAGVLGIGAVIAEMSLVLATVGAFAQLPGLKWLIGEGGELLRGIGTAIGEFVGGIVGGFLGGISAQFPQIGQDLTDFMTNAQGFIEGAKKIDPAMLQGVNALASMILLLTAANILDGLTKWFTGGTSLVKFGEELAEFGPYFKKYSDEVTGINPDVITASSNAALALAEMASKLPNSGGLAGKIFGENSLAEFGEELESFGPHIKKYGDSVSELNADAVKASAEAAQVLADMAAKLPNSGGLSAKILGDNTLSAFGKELEKFGPHIGEYAQQVKDIDPAVVKASAEAAQVLADMATTLPNSGGLAAKILGDNTLSAFGEELEKFGPHIAKYSQDVAGVQPTVVVASANAAKALSELANNLSNTGGLVSWFTGDNDIGKFGQSLEKFGQSFAGYYDSISGIDTALLDGVIIELGKLVDMANGISEVDTSGMSTFAKDLTAMGNNGIDGFVQAFTDANPKVQEGIMALLTIVTSTMQEQTETLTASGITAGQSLGTGIINGINVQKPLVMASVTAMCTALIQMMRAKLPGYTFIAIGRDVVRALTNGIISNKNAAVEAAREVGANVAQGLADGINSKVDSIANAAISAARTAIERAKKELDVHSPSGVFYEIGENVDLGMANGIRAYLGRVADAGTELGQETIDSMKSAISRISDVVNGEIDSEPTIRPVLDMTNVQNGAREIKSLFTNGLNMSVSYDKALAAGGSKIGSSTIVGDGDNNPKPASNSFNFVQNNYSPKSLSRVEIYRQTNNQFSAFERMVKA